MDSVLVESRVREQIRTLDLDPVVDSARVLHLIQECVSDLFAGGSLVDVPALVLEVHHQISGYGPLQNFSMTQRLRRFGSTNQPGFSLLEVARVTHSVCSP